MKRTIHSLTLGFLGLLATCGSVGAADWGTISMKFAIDGKASSPPNIVPTKDQAVCGKHPLPDESLVIGAGGELANVVVYLVPDKGAKVDVHPDYEKEKSAPVVLDNKDCRFVPHIALVRVGQTLELLNSDPVGHNSKIDFLTNNPINPILPAMGKFALKPADLAKSEKRATPVSCAIHPWMTGWVLVQDHPYMGVSDASGKLEIKNVPAGKWTFQVWQEKIGNLSDKNTTDSSGKAVAWPKGKATITVSAGANDLGVFKVKP